MKPEQRRKVTYLKRQFPERDEDDVEIRKVEDESLLAFSLSVAVLVAIFSVIFLTCAGCSHAPIKPENQAEIATMRQVLDPWIDQALQVAIEFLRKFGWIQ